MNNQISPSWVSCTWNFATGDGRAHPDDVDAVPKDWLAGCVAECLGEKDGFLILVSMGRQIRVAPFAYHVLPRVPRFELGDDVAVRSDHHSCYEGHIDWIGWHFKDEHYLYRLSGKPTRYQESDLELRK